MENKTFKILSIDGGGMRGLYSATILQELEEKYGTLVDYFDMICGTSTGGIIALGLSLGLSAKTAVEFYEKYGPKIFPPTNKLGNYIRSWKQRLFSSKYSDTDLRIALEDVFKKSVLNDSKCCLCIPTTNASSFAPVVLKTSHYHEFERDGQFKMVEAALATTAAPTYFPIAKLSNELAYMVDGGLWANNPALVGYMEAVTYFVGQDKEYDSVSIL
ncbi:MAG: CBASS cGAMP-activated phospholipase, partial [Planctomycetota bacterium]